MALIPHHLILFLSPRNFPSKFHPFPPNVNPNRRISSTFLSFSFFTVLIPHHPILVLSTRNFPSTSNCDRIQFFSFYHSFPPNDDIFDVSFLFSLHGFNSASSNFILLATKIFHQIPILIVEHPQDFYASETCKRFPLARSRRNGKRGRKEALSLRWAGRLFQVQS